MSRRIRHATDASSITGGSSINGNLQEGQDETDGVIAGSILSNVSVHPTNNINWFRSEIQRLKFGKLNSHSTSLMRRIYYPKAFLFIVIDISMKHSIFRCSWCLENIFGQQRS